MELKGVTRPMKPRHPAADLLEYAEGATDESTWQEDLVRRNVQTLKKNPQAWAFAADIAEEGTSKEEPTTEDEEPSEDEEDLPGGKAHSQGLWRKWLQKLDEH